MVKVPLAFGTGRAGVPILSDGLGIAKARELLVRPGALKVIAIPLLLDRPDYLLKVGATIAKLLLKRLLLAKGRLAKAYLPIGNANSLVLKDLTKLPRLGYL